MSHNVCEKLKKIGEDCHRVSVGETMEIPFEPGRDVEILPIRELPPKKGLSFKDGQGRLLHDLASIELQAMELAFRTLAEFPAAPVQFRDELTKIALEEAKHLELCLHALNDLAQPWGTYPTHIGLWQSVSSSDTLLDRIVIVHRYLEGSGLDASDHLRERLSGVQAAHIHKVVDVIATDEVEHVQFGSRWYREICRLEGLDPEKDFRPRLLGLIKRIPRRLERINQPLREKVGFSAAEISALNEVRGIWLQLPAERIHAAANSATAPR
jgi:uncharacterized ferritin-like protein (DUF455 family)